MALNRFAKIIVQLSFSNATVIPAILKRAKGESAEESQTRKSVKTNSIPLIHPTGDCDASRFLLELASAGFLLVSAFFQERIGYAGQSKGKKYFTVRFIFYRQELAIVTDETLADLCEIWGALLSMTTEVTWRVRSFDNPLFQDGEEITGKRSLSVILEVRNPGAKPKHTVRIQGEDVVLMPA